MSNQILDDHEAKLNQRFPTSLSFSIGESFPAITNEEGMEISSYLCMTHFDTHAPMVDFHPWRQEVQSS